MSSASLAVPFGRAFPSAGPFRQVTGNLNKQKFCGLQNPILGSRAFTLGFCFLRLAPADTLPLKRNAGGDAVPLGQLLQADAAGQRGGAAQNTAGALLAPSRLKDTHS